MNFLVHDLSISWLQRQNHLRGNMETGSCLQKFYYLPGETECPQLKTVIELHKCEVLHGRQKGQHKKWRSQGRKGGRGEISLESWPTFWNGILSGNWQSRIEKVKTQLFAWGKAIEILLNWAWKRKRWLESCIKN